MPSRDLSQREKRCYRCKRWLSAESYSSNRAQRDGLSSSCKGCKKDEERERRARRLRPAEPDDLPRTRRLMQREEARLTSALDAVRKCRRYIESLIEKDETEVASSSVSGNPIALPSADGSVEHLDD